MIEPSTSSFNELEDINKLRHKANKSFTQVGTDNEFLTNALGSLEPYYEKISGKDALSKIDIYKDYVKRNDYNTLWQMLTLDFEAIQQTEKRVVFLEKELTDCKVKLAQTTKLASRQCENFKNLQDVVDKALTTAESAKERDDKLLSAVAALKKQVAVLESDVENYRQTLRETSTKLKSSEAHNDNLKAELDKKRSSVKDLDKKTKELTEGLTNLRNKNNGQRQEILVLDDDCRTSNERIRMMTTQQERKMSEVRIQTQKEMEAKFKKNIEDLNQQNYQELMEQRKAQDSLKKELSEARKEIEENVHEIDEMAHTIQHLKVAGQRVRTEMTRKMLGAIHNQQDLKSILTDLPMLSDRFGENRQQFSILPTRSRSTPRTQETQTQTKAQTTVEPVVRSRLANRRTARTNNRGN